MLDWDNVIGMAAQGQALEFQGLEIGRLIRRRRWKGHFSRDASGSHRAGRNAERTHGREIVWGSLPILLISSLTLYSFLLLLFINPSPRSGMVFLGQGFQSNKVNQRKMTEWKPKIERILMRTCLGSTPKLITIMCFSCSRPFGPLFMYEPNCI